MLAFLFTVYIESELWLEKNKLKYHYDSIY